MPRGGTEDELGSRVPSLIAGGVRLALARPGPVLAPLVTKGSGRRSQLRGLRRAVGFLFCVTSSRGCGVFVAP